MTRIADESFAKPRPGKLMDLSDRLQVQVRKMLMIGDTTHYLQMVQAAGVDAIAVTYGAHPADALRSANSLACFDNVEVLGNWVIQNLYHQDPAKLSKAS